MTVRDAATLKGYFNAGDVPTESNFHDLIDTIFSLEGVTNGNNHDHVGGDGATLKHGNLEDIGTNSHLQIDTFISSKGLASGLASLNSSIKVVQNPASANANPTANAIPIADANGKLDGWISDGSTSVKGKVELATDGESNSGVVVQGNDSRLSNARVPTSHDLLSVYHGDTLGDTVVAGDLLIGNSTPKWSRLAKGTEGQVLSMGASLPYWKTEDGWISAGMMGTWTYSNTSRFTISGNYTSYLPKGTRIKLTQSSTVIYGTVMSSVYSSPNTTVELIPNSDYSLSNNTISNTYISYLVSPLGWPGWFNFSPSYTGFSVAPSNCISRFYPEFGRITVWHREVTNGTSNATSFTVSAPVVAITITNGAWQAAGMGTDNGVIGNTPALVQIVSASSSISCYKDWSAASWTNSGNKRIIFTLVYQW